MSAYWDWIASGAGSDLSTWNTGSDSYGDWGDPSTWVIPDTPWYETLADAARTFGGDAMDLLAKTFKNPDGTIDWRAVATAAGGIAGLMGLGGSSNRPVGYQGKIPTYTAVREAVPSTYDPNRRPGSGGQRYFSDMQYITPAPGAEGMPDTVTAARAAAAQQAQGLAALNAANPARQMMPPPVNLAPPASEKGSNSAPPASQTGSQTASQVIEKLPVPTYTGKQGGIVGLQPGGFVLPADVVSHAGNGSSDAGMRFLANRLGAQPIRGQGDGMSDSIRTSIAGQQPAAVAHEEMYLQPEQVRQLGGAQNLYAMMDRIRKARTGSTEQGRQINPDKFMPRQA